MLDLIPGGIGEPQCVVDGIVAACGPLASVRDLSVTWIAEVGTDLVDVIQGALGGLGLILMTCGIVAAVKIGGRS